MLLFGLWASICIGFGQSATAVWVTHEQVLEQGQLKTYTGLQRFPLNNPNELNSLVARLSRKAVGARFVWNKTRGWTLVEKQGYSFDAGAVKLAYQQAQEGGKKEFVLPVKIIQPSPSEVYYYRLGVRELIAEGRTNFRGSLPSRIHNIRLTSTKFDRALIAPNTVFSFNRRLGRVSAATGYQNAWVISGNRTVWGVGGGVCQVCTTLFRAAYFSGLPIVERYTHSYQVGYYKPTGLDATTAPPKDLRFRNDTPGYILIQVGVQGYDLTFRFFGLKDREVSWRGPYITNRIAPPRTRYIYSPSLRPGTYRQIDFAAEGARVWVYRTVSYYDGRLRYHTLFSQYKPWGAVYLVGPRSR